MNGNDPMYGQLKARLAAMLVVPRPLKPQTERQLGQYLAEYAPSSSPSSPSSGLAAFLLCAAEVLEDYELDILFGPLFTPALDDRAAVADLLYHWRPTAEQLARLAAELAAEVPHAVVRLPDGTDAKLTLHEVMAERFVRLLRLDAAADPATAAAVREALPADLWPVAVALLCERGMTPAHQAWFAAFVGHMTARRRAAGKGAAEGGGTTGGAGGADVSREMLEAAADFAAGQPDLGPPAVAAAAEALMRATQGTAAYAAGGHAYWSPDVAQHHHYRGQGRIDHDRLERRQAELERVVVLVEDVRSFVNS